MKTRIIIQNPKGDNFEIEAEGFILAFKETESSSLSVHVKMTTDEILATSVRLSHLALKNEESIYSNLVSKEKSNG